ncbi:hypothetical protein Q8F55_009268 [Vanrija albida]|uniref:F-box domain-containing protein n=1 Tax=Vanrija albida TaxID=181172 RepID=A0ABR3PT54_9TREE
MSLSPTSQLAQAPVTSSGTSLSPSFFPDLWETIVRHTDESAYPALRATCSDLHHLITEKLCVHVAVHIFKSSIALRHPRTDKRIPGLDWDAAFIAPPSPMVHTIIFHLKVGETIPLVDDIIRMPSLSELSVCVYPDDTSATPPYLDCLAFNNLLLGVSAVLPRARLAVVGLEELGPGALPPDCPRTDWHIRLFIACLVYESQEFTEGEALMVLWSRLQSLDSDSRKRLSALIEAISVQTFDAMCNDWGEEAFLRFWHPPAPSFELLGDDADPSTVAA